jgi:predicted protein tyrosine phosphatase
VKNEIELWGQMEEWGNIIDASNRKTIVIKNAKKKIIDSDNYCGRPVLGKIVVLPMTSLSEFVCDKPWSCISITDVGSRDRHMNNTNRVGIHRAQFDDIEFDRSELEKITKDQAKDIWEFVEEVWDKSELMMIHCVAGISRSTAVAKAISDVHQPTFSKYFDQLYSPNKLVYRVMKGAK